MRKQHQRQILETVTTFLKTFSERDYVALWRWPYLILENTFKSMIPSLADKYCQIIYVYCRQSWGIYDNTGDLQCSRSPVIPL